MRVVLMLLVLAAPAVAQRSTGALLDEAADEARELDRAPLGANVHEPRIQALLDRAADQVSREPAPPAVTDGLDRAWKELARYRLAQRIGDTTLAAAAAQDLLRAIDDTRAAWP